MWLTLLLTILVTCECAIVMYLPSYIGRRLSKIKQSKYFNMDNFENIASGSIIALALIHMLPEVVILSNNKNMKLYNIFILILISIVFLNVTDLLSEPSSSNTPDTYDTKIYIDQNNYIKDLNDKVFEENYENTNINKVDLEMKEVDFRINNVACKNNILFTILKSNSFFIILSLFIHSFVEGLLMGSLKNKNVILVIGLSMIAHKWAECLIIYNNVIKKNENKILEVIYAWSFILSFPLGVLIATFYIPSSELVEIIFTSIACGFFIYLSFNMTKDIKVTKTNKNYISFSYFFGACCMSAIMLIFKSIEDANTLY